MKILLARFHVNKRFQVNKTNRKQHKQQNTNKTKPTAEATITTNYNKIILCL